MKVPADVYARSTRVYRGLDELTYPFHDATFTVTQCGRICFKSRKVNLSHVFAGQRLGVTQVGERVWLVTFMRYDLGYFDDETCRLEPIDNPFAPKVSPLSRDFTRTVVASPRRMALGSGVVSTPAGGSLMMTTEFEPGTYEVSSAGNFQIITVR